MVCGGCLCCSGRFFLSLLPLCVDGALVCAEGYTQVTGVMAMMMTGRVLLVCALCVLWCGAGGRCDEVETTALGGGVEPLVQSQVIVKSPEGPQGLQVGPPDIKGEVPPASPGLKAEEEEDDDDGEKTEVEVTEDEVKITERQGDQGGTIAPESDSREKNLSVGRQEKNQAIISAEEIPPSDSREPNANPTQTEIEKKKDSDENTPAVENPLTTVNGEQTLPAEGNLPSSPEEGVDSHEQSGEDTTSEGEKNVPSPETATTPQSHRDEGSEGTGDDTKATTVTANTTDTTNKQNSDGSTVKMNDAAPQTAITTTAAQTNHTVTPADSDGSTAVSHSTSPLLLLLVVACAAA
ncbi:mucin-associated surface protein (MASP), putative, partial [Trypanosoma cruzi]